MGANTVTIRTLSSSQYDTLLFKITRHQTSKHILHVSLTILDNDNNTEEHIPLSKTQKCILKKESN